MSETSLLGRTRTIRALTRASLILVIGVALLVVVIAVASCVIDVIHIATASRVGIEVPLDRAFSGVDPAIVGSGATFDSATLFLELARSERGLLAAGHALQALTAVVVALAIGGLAVRMWRQRTFGRTLTIAGTIVAFTLIVLPAVGSFLADLGRNEAIARLGLHGPALYGFRFDTGPAVAGIAVAFVVTLLEVGERLQRDVAGLV